MIYLAAALVLCGVAALFDFRTGRIPNAITMWPLPLVIVARVVHAYAIGGAGAALWSLGYALAGAALCALVPLFMWRAGAAGGGDVKLLALVGALCLPMVGLEVETYAFAVAALTIGARLAWSGELFRTLKGALLLVVNPLRPKSKRVQLEGANATWFRFAPSIFAAMALVTITNWQ